MNRPRRALYFAWCLALFGCREAPAPAGDVDAQARPRVPDPELVLPVGTPGGVDIATWNIENFPLRADTVELVASLIASMEIDLIGVQEIADVDAFEHLLSLLPDYDFVLSSHTYSSGQYQKVGFIYRADVLASESVELLFTGESYAFPRPPLQVHFRVIAPMGGAAPLDFSAVVVHLKAGGDDTDRNRRRAAMVALDAHVRAELGGAGDPDMVLLGDFNESITGATSLAVWAPFIDAPDIYRVHTLDLPAGSYSYVPWASLIDHVVSTRSLDDELRDGPPEIPPLNAELTNYLGAVSDHLPVVTAMPGLLE